MVYRALSAHAETEIDNLTAEKIRFEKELMFRIDLQEKEITHLRSWNDELCKQLALQGGRAKYLGSMLDDFAKDMATRPNPPHITNRAPGQHDIYKDASLRPQQPGGRGDVGHLPDGRRGYNEGHDAEMRKIGNVHDRKQAREDLSTVKQQLNLLINSIEKNILKPSVVIYCIGHRSSDVFLRFSKKNRGR